MSAFNLASRSPAPNSAAAQALLELTGRAPEEGALPVDALGYARRGYKGAGPGRGDRMIPRCWPRTASARKLLFTLLEDWEGSLREAVEAAEALRAA